MDLIMEEEQLDATKVRDAQREIERRRKTELYEQKNKEAENSRLARNQRALERSMNPTQKIKTGRRLMKRSKPISQTKVGSKIVLFSRHQVAHETLGTIKSLSPIHQKNWSTAKLILRKSPSILCNSDIHIILTVYILFYLTIFIYRIKTKNFNFILNHTVFHNPLRARELARRFFRTMIQHVNPSYSDPKICIQDLVQKLSETNLRC